MSELDCDDSVRLLLNVVNFFLLRVTGWSLLEGYNFVNEVSGGVEFFFAL